MYDFLACEEAMVLDEGLDVFQLVNPRTKGNEYSYDNEQILAAVAKYMRVLQKFENAKNPKLWDLPLNKAIFNESSPTIKFKNRKEPRVEEIFPVVPQRSQIRAVIIFARKESQSKRKRDSRKR